ncbi:MAG TPA: DUF2892 domain-containing protein [Gammaproteobacteria bacterium]|nr:DUF2892 domain-containing protein [Gammaproteobacteria bacterium]
MMKNVGTIDRTIRIIAGIAIIGAGLYYQNWWGAIGAVPLLTGVMGWCPPYALFGWNTCSTKKG